MRRLCFLSHMVSQLQRGLINMSTQTHMDQAHSKYHTQAGGQFTANMFSRTSQNQSISKYLLKFSLLSMSCFPHSVSTCKKCHFGIERLVKICCVLVFPDKQNFMSCVISLTDQFDRGFVFISVLINLNLYLKLLSRHFNAFFSVLLTH